MGMLIGMGAPRSPSRRWTSGEENRLREMTELEAWSSTLLLNSNARPLPSIRGCKGFTGSGRSAISPVPLGRGTKNHSSQHFLALAAYHGRYEHPHLPHFHN
jgi:hypothetical protein